jgi:choline dehydrogenase-like flavoprotein
VLIDGTLLPYRTTLRSDVVVVGAGPAGLTVAQELAAAGIDVMVVEGGGRHHTKADDDTLRGEAIGKPFPMVTSRRRGFGGTSGHWTSATGLRVRPFDEIDFEARPVRPGASWPFGRSALDPYYDRAHAQIGINPDYRPERWFAGTHPSSLTWTGGPEPAMFQFTAHDTYVGRFDEITASPYIDLVLNSTITTMDLSADGASVTGADVVCPGGNEFRVEGRVFVLAAGGIDNARILLSSPGRNGNGIGNEHDNVGRYFMDHLSFDCGVLDALGETPLDIAAFVESDDDTGQKFQPMLWLGAERIQREDLLNAAFWVYESDPAYLSPGISAARSLRASFRSHPVRHAGTHLFGVAKGGIDIASFGLRSALHRQNAKRSVSLRIMAEQLPDRESRVLLADKRDALGRRRVCLDWRVSNTDLDMMRRHRELLVEMLQSRGVARLRDGFDPESPHGPPVMTNFHHMGSTRMHVDPAEGVVDAELRVHSTRNLYVAGSSVIPTGGYLNPTLTIIALSCRLADTVRTALGPVRVQPPLS